MPTDPPDIEMDDRMPEFDALSQRIIDRIAALRREGLDPDTIVQRVSAEFRDDADADADADA
jgi:pilus assembly protein TadC